jgi:hypothetical protein
MAVLVYVDSVRERSAMSSSAPYRYLSTLERQVSLDMPMSFSTSMALGPAASNTGKCHHAFLDSHDTVSQLHTVRNCGVVAEDELFPHSVSTGMS